MFFALCILFFFFFFFSSRRRHTRFDCDWSSDVCSSDLSARTSRPETVDTLWYHLPQAARFVQTGSILHLHYFDNDPVTAFYPSRSEERRVGKECRSRLSLDHEKKNIIG